jgi:inorganic pyrophosphatase-like protein
MMPDAPAFDPSQPFETVGGGGAAPPFDPSKPFEPVEAPSYGTLESAGEGYLKGASANWRDEVYGASKASGLPDILGGFRAPIGAGRLAYEHMTGTRGPATEEYERARDEMRARERAMQQQHPYAFGAGELGGAGASMLVAPGSRAATVAGRLGSAAVTGAGYGAVAGAGEGEGAADTGKGALTGAATGATLGTVGGVAAEAVSPLVNQITNVVRGIRDPELEASRRIATHVTNDLTSRGQPLTNEELAVANTAGTPRTLVDAGESTRALARSSANTSPEARSALTEFTQERFEQQSPRVAGFIRDLTGGGNATDDLERIQDVARRANRPAYRAAYAAGEDGLWTPELERLAGSPAVRRAMQSAVERGRDRAVSEGYGAFNPGVSFENGVMQFGRGRGAPPYPNMQFWDYTQRELRDAATAATRSGRNEEAGALNGLRRNLLTELDAANPAFGRARQGAAQFFGAENALEAGQNFVRSSANINEARRAYARMSPPERELFARGYASNLADAVERAGTNRNVLNSAFLNNTAAQQRTQLALGPARARQLEALLRAERVVDRPRTAIQGNSTTARQLMEMGLAGGATAGAEGLLEQDFNPTHILTGALLWRGARQGAQLIDQRVARRVGEMLTSNDPTILARGVQAAARNPAILNRLRQLTSGVAGAGTEAAVEGLHQKPGQGFDHGGSVHSESVTKAQGRASGGRVNPANIDHSPTQAQKAAGNYAKDHVKLHGLDIAIENAKGKKREGVGRDGKKWSVTMPAHYGYIKRTTGRDGDHVDVYLGPHIKSPRVYVVDQHDADSKRFDEHKAFIGFGSAAQVRATYRKAFSDGRGNERLRHLTEMSVDGFKAWLAHGDTTKPLKRAVGGRADGGSTFQERAEASAPPSENIEDRRSEHMGDLELVFRQANHLANKFIPPYPKTIRRPIERPSGRLAVDAGFDDVGGRASGGRAEGGEVDEDYRPLSGAGQWQAAIAANAQRQANAPSMGQQIMDIAGNTGSMLAAPLMMGPRLMGDVAEGRLDPNSPEAIRRSADVALNTAGMGMLGAERGAVGAVGGKPLAKGLAPEAIGRAWGDHKLLSSTVRRMKFDKAAEDIAQVHNDLSETAGTIRGHEEDIARITPEDRATLAPDEVFTAEQEHPEEMANAAFHAQTLRDHIAKIANRAGNLLGREEIPALDEHSIRPQLSADDADAIERASTRQTAPGLVNKWGIDDLAEEVHNTAQELAEQHPRNDAERIAELKQELRAKLEALHGGASQTLSEIDARLVRSPHERASGGRIIGAKSQSEVGLSQNAAGTTFRCGTCRYFDRSTCHNANPELKGRSVKPRWCCNLYDHAGMKVIA